MIISIPQAITVHIRIIEVIMPVIIISTTFDERIGGYRIVLSVNVLCE